ncbi:HlyU family transcriptional regulator [Aliiroseovarius sp. KMU-50]|uniref:HlyU family transcriptional regulator n=1 Tax=Aliiroseovarius salicola TaxID=3009082 RepID=A0ABT4W2M3_9RHOB|nr:HlyU family transcriptional regulator [Aliiroseovarius sp. KMU-50]MDA5094731.1 HlyU family transcriptional regulator [Aliiroseovarius sp. KMU-50]
MSLFSKLFGGGTSDKGKVDEPELYNGYSIYLEPAKDAGGYRIGARIEKEIDGELKSHLMLRADVLGSEEDAKAESLRKAKIFIDQMGDRIFG